MNTPKTKFTLLLLFTIALCSGCVNLKSVYDFSSTSALSIKKYEALPYSFDQHCFERCQLESIRNFNIKRDVDCQCESFKKADSVTMLIYQEINGYFKGLSNLADNKLTAYRIDTLNTALKEGDFGALKIEKEHVDAYSKISLALLRASTDTYRRRKLKLYIANANAPLQILMAKFQFILQKNLQDQLRFKKEKLYAYYMDMKMNNTLSDYEKGKATMDYYEKLSELNNKQQQIETFAQGIQTIAAGHQKLYDHRNKMNAKEAKELLEGYTGYIQDIVSGFNKLNKR